MNQVDLAWSSIGFAKLPLDEAKTGIGGELCVASNHEVQIDGVVEPCQHSPHEVLHRRCFYSGHYSCQHQLWPNAAPCQFLGGP